MSERLLCVRVRSANRDDDEVRYGDRIAGKPGCPALKIDNHEIGFGGGLIDTANDDVVVVVATRAFSDFARAVPNLKRLEFRFPFLENRSARSGTSSSDLASRSSTAAIWPPRIK